MTNDSAAAWPIFHLLISLSDLMDSLKEIFQNASIFFSVWKSKAKTNDSSASDVFFQSGMGKSHVDVE